MSVVQRDADEAANEAGRRIRRYANDAVYAAAVRRKRRISSKNVPPT